MFLKKIIFIYLLILLSVNTLFAQTRDEQVAQYRNIVNLAIETARTANSPVLVNRYLVRAVNSAGGVSCFVEFVNISNKRIKYISFSLVPYNAVGDPVRCTINGNSQVTLQNTGFFEINPPNANYYNREFVGWGNVWYNHDVRSIRITGIEITFKDNSSVTLNQNQINASILPNGNDFEDRIIQSVIRDGR